MHAIKAIYDGVSFMPKQPIPVIGKYEVVNKESKGFRSKK